MSWFLTPVCSYLSCFRPKVWDVSAPWRDQKMFYSLLFSHHQSSSTDGKQRTFSRLLLHKMLFLSAVMRTIDAFPFQNKVHIILVFKLPTAKSKMLITADHVIDQPVLINLLFSGYLGNVLVWFSCNLFRLLTLSHERRVSQPPQIFVWFTCHATRHSCAALNWQYCMISVLLSLCALYDRSLTSKINQSSESESIDLFTRKLMTI